jgi:hypothetical protein
MVEVMPSIALVCAVEKMVREFEQVNAAPDHIEIRMTKDAVPLVADSLFGLRALRGLPVELVEEPAAEWYPPRSVVVEVVAEAGVYSLGACQVITAECLLDAFDIPA